MSVKLVIVSFVGFSQTAALAPGQTVLEGAQDVGVDIATTCGGRGRCRSCRIQLVSGQRPAPTSSDVEQLAEEEIHEGYRLSCQCMAAGDLTVRIAPPLTETGFQILVGTETGEEQGSFEGESGVRKVHVRPQPPQEEHHQTSDLDEVLREAGIPAIDGIPLSTLSRLPRMLRKSQEGLSVTTFGEQVLDVEPGDTTSEVYGVAVDIGTTSVVTYLMDLRGGTVVASVSGLNPQAVYGGDLMSRIAFAMKDPKNVSKLRTRVVRFVNEQINEACAQAGITKENIYKAVIVGNTCMHHVFLGIDPSFVGKAPYAPVMRHGHHCAAHEAGLRINPGARLFLLPLVAGFVGADTMGMVLATRLHEATDTEAAVDIGTNAEVVMGNRDRLMACSSPAGPALEGGQIRCGMRAAAGAIESVRIDPELHVGTIGDAPPLGICGSGVIDAVAALLDTGIVDPSGRMLLEPPSGLPDSLLSRLREDESGLRSFVLASAEESASEKDIVVGQDDIRQLQLAKAAILSGVVTLQRFMAVSNDDLARLLIAGGFGNYLSIRSARRIGLIPDLPESKIRYVSNAAGRGAQMALLREDERTKAKALAERIEHISLAAEPEFQNTFIEATKFPPEIAADPS